MVGQQTATVYSDQAAAWRRLGRCDMRGGDCEIYGNSEFEIEVFTLGIKPSRLSLLAADIQVQTS
jgi:hypothetical protein